MGDAEEYREGDIMDSPERTGLVLHDTLKQNKM
jgi:hypothetical protein